MLQGVKQLYSRGLGRDVEMFDEKIGEEKSRETVFSEKIM
jgi:hypothetical protein